MANDVRAELARIMVELGDEYTMRRARYACKVLSDEQVVELLAKKGARLARRREEQLVIDQKNRSEPAEKPVTVSVTPIEPVVGAGGGKRIVRGTRSLGG